MPSPPGSSRERLRIRPGVLEWREVDGEIVILDLRSATYLAVSGAGATVWPALLNGADREQLVAILLDTFDVAPERAAEDVEAFISELTTQDLLQRADEQRAPNE